MQVIVRALVGNYNYNLNHELDIRKFKIFVIPNTIETLYQKKKLGESFPYEVEDIRIWISRLISGDILYIETLFSDYVEVSCADVFYAIHAKREAISLMNLKGVYNSCINFYNDNINKVDEDKEGLGYDRLLAFEIYRQLDFVIRYAQGYNFIKALRYTREERTYIFKLLMTEKLELKCVKGILNSKKNFADGYLPIYNEHKVDSKTRRFLVDLCNSQLLSIGN